MLSTTSKIYAVVGILFVAVLAFSVTQGTNPCPTVPGSFGAIKAPTDAMSLSEVRMLASGFSGGPVALNVLMPRFNSRPAGLAWCTGIAYDQKTGQHRVGRKFLAYLAPSQPQLATLPR